VPGRYPAKRCQLAQLLAAELRRISPLSVHRCTSIKFIRFKQAVGTAPADLEQQVVILVDDVLNSAKHWPTACAILKPVKKNENWPRSLLS